MDIASFLLAAAAFVAGVWIMVEGAEKFTEGLLRVSIAFGASTFVLGYLLSGVDLENLAVGIAGATADMPDVALGTVIGSAIFLLTFAVGATALVAPIHAALPRRLLIATLSSPVPIALLALDGLLSRVDGAILFGGSLVLIGYVLRTARSAPLLAPGQHKLDKALRERPRWWGPMLVVGASAAIVLGAHLFQWSVREIVGLLGWHATWLGMIVVAAAVSFEEVPRMVVPARRGHGEISAGNILGTVMFFVLFNAGAIAMVRPLIVEPIILQLYWPAMMIALGLVVSFLWRGTIGRPQGAALLALYVLYVSGAIALDLWFER